ncbi:MAG: ABC transporter permease, partial [Candidatus Woesearchaeota archaeon]
MISDLLKLAFGNLKNRRLRSWLTMIGIFIGIAAVVSLIGLGEGLRSAVMSQFGFLGPDMLSVQAGGIQMGPPGQGAAKPLSDDLADEIRDVAGVETAFNRYTTSVRMEFNDIQSIRLAASSPEEEYRRVFERSINLKAQQGRLLKDGDNRRAVLGSNFLEDDNPFSEPIKDGDTILLNGVEFEVAGILEKKGSFMFDGSIFLNEDPMLEYLRDDDGTADIIAVKAESVDKVDEVKEDIEDILREERDVEEGEEDFTVETPQQTLEQLNSTLFAVQLFIYIIATISLLVGGIGIMNTMYTAVVERTEDLRDGKAIISSPGLTIPEAM